MEVGCRVSGSEKKKEDSLRRQTRASLPEKGRRDGGTDFGSRDLVGFFLFGAGV